jgi:hypothetical protein
MKMRRFLAVLILGAIALGCIPSIHPLYTDKDVIFDPALLGVWGGQDTIFSWEFYSDDSTSYTLIYTDDSASSSFTVHLVLLDEHLFMDLYPDEPECGTEFYNMYMVPTHAIARVFLQGDMLRLDALDMEWVEEMIEDSAYSIAHERLENDAILITAGTADLQKLVLKGVDNRDAFAEGDELYRKQ